MKRLLNTLFVQTQGAYLARDGLAVAVRIEEEIRLRVPMHTLGGIVCFGRVNASPGLMRLCADHGVLLAFLTENGEFLARVHGPVAGNVLLRRAQYRWADSADQSAQVARAVIAGKVANSRSLLLRSARERESGPQAETLRSTADELARLLEGLERCASVETLRGREGEAARIYFSAFDALITSDEEEFRFHGRSRRPPLDPVNALLSFLYTLVAHDVTAALESVGLDPYVGLLHEDRPGRPGLALDLMEEFRPVLADRLALALINRRQVRASGFRKSESGAVAMDDATRKEVLVAYQERKRTEVQHAFLEERMPIGLLPHAQALLLARHIRGDIDAYPPYVFR